MRLFSSALCTAVAAGIFAGCSGGLGSSIPGGTQSVMPAANSGLHMVSGAGRAQSCGSQYITCVTISKKSPQTVEICISDTGNCTSGSFPPYTWKQKIVTLKGKKFTKIVGSIKPKKGNPIEDTIKEKSSVPSSKGKVKYAQDITACPSSGSCLDGEVGIVTS